MTYKRSSGLKRDRELQILNRLYMHNIVNRSKRKSMEYDLTFEEYKTLILSECQYCGEKGSNLSQSFRDKSDLKIRHNGIDRVNSDLGYIKDNCVSCCKTCNVAKRNMSKEEFLFRVKKIHKFQLNKNIINKNEDTDYCI